MKAFNHLVLGHIDIEKAVSKNNQFGKVYKRAENNLYNEDCFYIVKSHIAFSLSFNKDKNINVVTGICRGTEEIAASVAIENGYDLTLVFDGDLSRAISNPLTNTGKRWVATKIEEILAYEKCKIHHGSFSDLSYDDVYVFKTFEDERLNDLEDKIYGWNAYKMPLSKDILGLNDEVKNNSISIKI